MSLTGPDGTVYANTLTPTVANLPEVTYQGVTLHPNIETTGAWTARSVVETRTQTVVRCEDDFADECVEVEVEEEYGWPITYLSLKNVRIPVVTPPATTPSTPPPAPTTSRGIGANTGDDS